MPSSVPMQSARAIADSATLERHRRAVHQPRVEIAAEMVGAEPVRERRRRETVHHVELVRIGGRDPGREERRDQHQHHDAEPRRAGERGADPAQDAQQHRHSLISGRAVSWRMRGSIAEYDRSTIRFTATNSTTMTSDAPCTIG